MLLLENSLSYLEVQKMEDYDDPDTWDVCLPTSTSQHLLYTQCFETSIYTNQSALLQSSAPSSRPNYHSLATPHLVAIEKMVPSSSPQIPQSSVKLQPAFEPTWQGFLATTNDAMIIIEAALQGRLSHVNRRPNDEERAKWVTSGTVLVYEENASGIKRWTDALHWSPSRVMNNFLIYRQLDRASKHKKKEIALGSSCSTRRERKGNAGSTVTEPGERFSMFNADYGNTSSQAAHGEGESLSMVHASFAQTMNPDQQRRFCGPFIDSDKFKEGGLMKKTISVNHRGTYHHVVSYYSLEDVVSGKLKRPKEDSRLVHIQPRTELLTGWKASLEVEESKDMPLVAGDTEHIRLSHTQHHAIGAVGQSVGVLGVVQTHAPLYLHIPEYWHGPHGSSHRPDYQNPH